jgi:hypothetical protein
MVTMHQIDQLVALAEKATDWLEHRHEMFDYEAEHGHFEHNQEMGDSDDAGVEIADAFLAIMRNEVCPAGGPHRFGDVEEWGTGRRGFACEECGAAPPEKEL